MSVRQSTPGHWERYWAEREEIDDVYSNEDRIAASARARCRSRGGGVWRWAPAPAGTAWSWPDAAPRSWCSTTCAPPSASSAGRPIALGLTVHPVCADAQRMPFRDGDLRPRLPPGAAGALPRPDAAGARERPGDRAGRPPPRRRAAEVPRLHRGQARHDPPRPLVRRVGDGVHAGRARAGLACAPGCESVRTYGEWMVPGFFYRSLRYALMRGRVTRLPKYPREIWPFGPLGRAGGRGCGRRRAGLYTCAMIGTLGAEAFPRWLRRSCS